MQARGQVGIVDKVSGEALQEGVQGRADGLAALALAQPEASMSVCLCAWLAQAFTFTYI